MTSKTNKKLVTFPLRVETIERLRQIKNCDGIPFGAQIENSLRKTWATEVKS